MKVNTTLQVIFFFATLFSVVMATFSICTMIQEATAQETDVLGLSSVVSEKKVGEQYVCRDPSVMAAKKDEAAILFGEESYKSPVVIKGGFPELDDVERSAHELQKPSIGTLEFCFLIVIISFIILIGVKLGISRVVYIIQIDDVYNPCANFKKKHGPFSKRMAMDWLAREGIDTECIKIDILFYSDSSDDRKLWVGRDNISNYYITK